MSIRLFVGSFVEHIRPKLMEERVIIAFMDKIGKEGDITMSLSHNTSKPRSDEEALKRHYSKKFRKTKELTEQEAAKRGITLHDQKSNMGFYLHKQDEGPITEPSLSYTMHDTDLDKAKDLASTMRDHLKQESVLLFHEKVDGKHSLFKIHFPKRLKPETIAKWVAKLKLGGGAYHKGDHTFTSIAFGDTPEDSTRKFVQHILRVMKHDPELKVEEVRGDANFI